MAIIAILRSKHIEILGKICSIVCVLVITFTLFAAYKSIIPLVDKNISEQSDTSEDLTITIPETSEPKTDESVVYITPSGKKFHVLASCAGVNAIEKPLSEVKATHDPCKTCAKEMLNTDPEQTTSDAVTVPDSSATTESVSSEDGNEITVYKTKTGKRYHISEACAGKNAMPITLSEAEKAGLTICNTCKNK